MKNKTEWKTPTTECIKIISEFETFIKLVKDLTPRKCQNDALKALYSYVHTHYLFNMCCGSGKTFIAAFLIYKEILESNNANKLAKIMIASHRLLLNDQIVRIVNEALSKTGITNVDWWSLSSNVGFCYDSNNKPTIEAYKFTKNSIDSINCSDKHVIVVACAASEKKHFDETKSNTILESIFEERFEAELEENTQTISDNTNNKFFNLIIQDEIHKDIPIKILNNFDKISNKIYGFTATPNRKNLEWFGRENVFTYKFSEALSDGNVCYGKLYVSKTNVKKVDKQEATHLIECYEHLNEKCLEMSLTPVFLNYFSAVDNLPIYENSIIKKYGDKVDVAVFASLKAIKDNKNFTKYIVQCSLNGNPMDKEKLLKYCQRDNKEKPLIILSAFMIVEGIDIPDINGVGIWCEKNDANMFQAACRGCRVDNEKYPNKTHFYIYTSKELAFESKEFLTKLYNGFDGKLDFGDGQEDCKGKGKKDNNGNGKNNKDGYTIVPAKSINGATAVINEIVIEFEQNKHELDLENEYKKIELEILKESTRAKAIYSMIRYNTNKAVNYNRLYSAINEFYK